MIKELIARVFCTRNCAHLAHWNEDSGYRHEVLGEFYGDIVDLLDKFVETYIGNFGELGSVKIKGEECESLMSCLEDDLKWMEANAEEITQDVCALENILDELMGVYLQTRFKLKQLK